jgi:hypothetical protein|tara:strand:+ start:757 stop:972 length:216 start_codon:yes stop_codon:yes gene_type:complete
MVNKKVEQLEEVLFAAVIKELSEEPTAGWAQVARGLLSDYRGSLDELPSLRSEEIKTALRDSAPFKINKIG